MTNNMFTPDTFDANTTIERIEEWCNWARFSLTPANAAYCIGLMFKILNKRCQNYNK